MDSKKNLLKRDSSPSSDTSDSRQSQVHRNTSHVDQPRVTVLQEISHNNASHLGHTYYKGKQLVLFLYFVINCYFTCYI